MGCGPSKQQLDKLNTYKQKLDELIKINDQLSKQIVELKDLKNLRKPIYIIKDQETEDLTKYKEELERKFQMIEAEIIKINKQLQIQVKADQKRKRKTNKPLDLEDIVDEEEWKKNMLNDNEITIKPIEDALIDIEQNQQNQDEQSQLSDVLQIDSQQNIKNQIVRAGQNEQENNEQSQIEKKITLQIDNKIQQQVVDKDINNDYKNQKHSNNSQEKNEQSNNYPQEPQLPQNLKSSDIEIVFNESIEQVNQSPDNQLSTLPKRKKQIEKKQQNQNQTTEQQLFFTKQRSLVQAQTKNSKHKYQI